MIGTVSTRSNVRGILCRSGVVLSVIAAARISLDKLPNNGMGEIVERTLLNDPHNYFVREG